MRRITVTLSEDEREALYDLAQVEHRDTRKQAAWLIRKELERRGLLGDKRQLAVGQREHADAGND